MSAAIIIVSSNRQYTFIDLFEMDNKGIYLFSDYMKGFGRIMQVIIDNNALPAFIGLLQHTKNSIQKEAAWAISNITAGNPNQIQAVITAGLLPHIVNTLVNVSFKASCMFPLCIVNVITVGFSHLQ